MPCSLHFLYGFFFFFFGDFTTYNGLKHDAKVLCSIPKHRKAVMCLAEKISICVLGNLHSGMTYSTVAIQC